VIERVDTSRGRIALHSWGAGVGEPLVCLHGFTGSGETWRLLGLALGSARQIIAPDLPGHGETRADAFGFEVAAALVVEGLERIGVHRFALLGYSMGGRLALGLTLDHPRRVVRLALESASPGLRSAAERAERRAADRALAADLEQGGLEAFVERWEAQPLFSTLSRLTEQARRSLRRQRLAQSASELAACLRGLGTGSQPWLGERLGELAAPVLVVAGAEDAKFRDWATWMSARIPRAELAIVAGVGHVPHLERPQETARRLQEFLARPDQPPVTQEEPCRSNGKP
jgi:2-succinyl-6-hydroxy-2,4-cyclohexadiene-1-carboxylate synthase